MRVTANWPKQCVFRAVCVSVFVLATSPQAAVVTGDILDARSGKAIPARIYIQSDTGRWFFAESASPTGSAIRYEKRNWVNTNAVEMHVTLTAHPFRVEVPPGNYIFSAERGTEFRPLTNHVKVGNEPVRMRLPLQRWINMAERGWFSGDTHVHRSLAELPNVMLAEDLNVSLPLTSWVTKAFTPPSEGDKNIDANARPELIRVDATHVIWPRNTEWEIFTIGERRHHLGAVFALGHKSAFTAGAPPVGPIAEQARREGGLLDLDKHDWPWSVALVPLMNVDLFELANNHLWRTDFAMSKWSGASEDFVGQPGDGWSGTEREWIEAGCKYYYALLDCGFPLRVSAGTANGVHPVPLGFSRVYVECPNGFSFEAWWRGLRAGRSFVTTGPMLLAKADGQPAGSQVKLRSDSSRRVEIVGQVISDQPVSAIEFIVNGEVVRQIKPRAKQNREGASETQFREAVELTGSSWVAVRCWEPRDGGRVRFAHTSPWFFDVPGVPQRPRRAEVEMLMRDVRREIERSSGVLPDEAIAEYRQALAVYEGIARQARSDAGTEDGPM